MSSRLVGRHVGSDVVCTNYRVLSVECCFLLCVGDSIEARVVRNDEEFGMRG